MSLDPITAGMDLAGKLIDRFIPDPQAKLAAQSQLAQMAQTGELARLTAQTDVIKAQLDVNATEAESSSLFIAGGRPFLIWVCGAAFASQYVVAPFVTWIAALTGHAIAYPQLDMNTMMPVLLGVLGLGGFRTYEKVKGVTK